jgi:putative tryptophan/tyrosine transport system substrate-binding protein
MNRRTLLASLGAACVLRTRLALARTSAGVRFLGLLLPEPQDSCEELKKGAAEGFKELAALGFVEGRNLVVEWHCFGGDYSRATRIAADLVRRGVDVLYTNGTASTHALQDATKTIPIFTWVNDPVASGFTRNLVRPDSNVTGLTQTHPDLPAKQIELIRRVVPKLERLVLIGDINEKGARELLRPHEAAARSAGLPAEVKLVERSGFEPVFSEMKFSRTQAAFIQFWDLDHAQTAKLAIRYGVPTMLYDRGYIEHGGLMSFTMYHQNDRSATILAKLLKGVKPVDIPWELPNRTYFAINLATAKLLGLRIPPDLLLRADQVIE